MATCEVCGNEDVRAMTIEQLGERHVFDSFECAVTAMAPQCGHCGCRIIGHGMQYRRSVYCCRHCAAAEGAGVERASGLG